MIHMEFKNILIIKPSAAGDIISAMPVLPALKKRYPNARITWMVASHLADLLRGHPMIDELIEFDRRRFGYLALSWIVAKRFRKFLRRLRNQNFDLVLDFQGLFRSGFFAWITRAPVRVGPTEKRELGWIFYTHRLPTRPHDTHIVDRIASVGELLGLDLADPNFVVYIPNSAKQKIHDALTAQNLQPGHFIALAPGGTWSSKRWPVDRFAELARKILSDLQIPVGLIGGNGERTLADEILRSVDSPNLKSFVGLTSLPELLALIDAARALVCKESGPMHMAVALNKPLTAVIGPTNANRTGPYRRPKGIVKSAEPCSPCYKRKCPKSTDENLPPCMTLITVDDVFNNLQSQLRR